MIQIVGGKRNGEHIKWFGNRVNIDGVPHVLYRMYLTDDTYRQCYVIEGVKLSSPPGIRALELCK